MTTQFRTFILTKSAGVHNTHAWFTHDTLDNAKAQVREAQAAPGFIEATINLAVTGDLIAAYDRDGLKYYAPVKGAK